MSLSPPTYPASPLRYPHETPPATAEDAAWLEVADGIFWLRLPLPFALNHVHVWVLRDGDGWFVIDSGIGGKFMQGVWDRLIAERLDGKPITRLLITHFHPDHIGSAGYLWEKFQPELLMTQTEWLTARMLALDVDYSVRDVAVRHYGAMGLPDDITAQLTGNGNRYAAAITMPPARFTPLTAGQILTINGDAWQVLTGGGHSPLQVQLYCAARNIFVSADQILPRISPNVSVWASNPTDDALAAYLKSLEETRQISADALVLPSHNLPFYGLHERLDELKGHHEERLEQIVALCRVRPHTIAEITTEAFNRPLDSVQTSFAIGEMLAHANYLLNKQALHKEIDKNGVWQFSSI